MIPPPNQSQRSIGFFLLGTVGGDQSFEFGLRPEEVSYQEPSRLQVNQTLGGAWADSFGRGVGSISLGGTTGWRGSLYQSGEELHAGLRSTVFAGWHEARETATADGSDPNDVELWYVDSLNAISALVAPRSFTLRRSKSSPLLMRYQIQLLVLQDADEAQTAFDAITASFTDPLRWLLAVTGLGNVIDQIHRYIGAVRAVFGQVYNIVQAFVGVGLALLGAVVEAADLTVGLFGEVEDLILGTALSFCYAAANAFSIIADDVARLASDVVAIQSIGNAFLDAACAMANAFDLIGLIPNYRALRGASGCSSTGGGDPASVFTVQDVNPFGYLVPTAEPPVTVSEQAQIALLSLQDDPLLMVGQQDRVYALMDTAAQGITVA